jgi:hypothetical protein
MPERITNGENDNFGKKSKGCVEKQNGITIA